MLVAYIIIGYVAVAFITVYILGRIDNCDFDEGYYAIFWPLLILLVVAYFCFVIPGEYLFNEGKKHSKNKKEV